MTAVGVPDPAEVEVLAEWLGAMDEARNVFDLTDEATTVISIDVNVLAERIADHDRARDRELGERIAAAVAAAVNTAYGTDPRHDLIGKAVAENIAGGTPMPWGLGAHFGRAESECAQHTGTGGE